MSEYLYGRNPVWESLLAKRRKHCQILLSQEAKKEGRIAEILDLASQQRLPVSTIPKFKLEKLIKNDHHQGIVLETSSYPYVDISEIINLAKEKNEEPFLLLLNLLQDPQNVGSLLRTAEAVGIHGVVIQERRAVGITPAVINSSSGAVEHLLIAQVSNISQIIRNLQKENIWFYGLEKAKGAKPLTEVDFSGGVGLVLGSEGEGLRDLVKKTCDELVYIPMKGKVDSLNAAIAGSIALYKVWEKRKYK